MQDRAVRTLSDAERRRMAAVMLAAAQRTSAGPHGARGALGHCGGPDRGHSAPRPRRESHQDRARRVVPVLAEWLGSLGFRAAFLSALAAWSIAAALLLSRFEVVQWW